ncbi:MAG: N-acetylmuramoyl-L-alanine amidase [Muribaculaceae bacterium]|nr:N-acetylmuramoyl-L-alanine amidase [Muribaculaceae bacterium]
MKRKRKIMVTAGVIAACACLYCSASHGCQTSDETTQQYEEISHPTPNVDPNKVNDVKGIILHHTAEPTVERSLWVLTEGPRHVGTHVVIDTDGTRYIMCRPDQVTYHAGKSVLAGREGCNNFTVGIELQGNTLEKPLTEDQINSAVEYMIPIIKKYNIPLENIVTHEMIRNNYKKRHPRERVAGKVDITPTEYHRVMTDLKARLGVE